MSTAGARGVSGRCPPRQPSRTTSSAPPLPAPRPGPPSPALRRLRELFERVRELDPEAFPVEERRSVATTLESMRSLLGWHARRVRARLDLDAPRP